MVQSAPQLLTVDEFIHGYGDDDRYELIDGELIHMEPTGPHEQVAALIGRKLNVEIDRQDTAYFIPYRCLIRLLGTETAFRPDVIVLDKPRLVNEPLWQQEPVITLGASIKLVIEVVSTNWQNDYARKLEDYAILGIRRVLDCGLSWCWWQRVYGSMSARADQSFTLTPSPSPKKRERGARLPVPLLPQLGEGVRGC